ncbi:hypothetical protein [Clostridium botulinum]|uniref:hypothetical protein n=1 Tax=Clostridium botulinum TaxID=1491 RepID=UPI0007741450|nr:hypothetical protein [Clostridium botulinum]MBY6929900.1 hypothetical protein [Clostridium botulinum]NFG19094.1 hypothetical protein [Clostridium botulinum]NFO80944.1 hypothetical protein [Clostridium botulinum]
MLNNMKDIPKINESTKYWIVRSGVEGRYFDDFYNGKCIALGWDKIHNINQIKKMESVNELKEIVVDKYSGELKTNKDIKNINRKVGDISTKIYKFINELKNGDIIVTPGKDEILIGKVTSEAYFIRDKFNELSHGKEEEVIGELNKARDVEWLKRINRQDLEPNLRLILRVFHGIAHINNQQVITEINRTIYDFYIKRDEGHTVYRIKSQEEIEFNKYANFIYNINGVYNLIKDDFEDSKLTIKTNVQSPGPVELIGSAVLVSTILSAMYFILKNKRECINGLSNKQKEKLEKFADNNPNEYDYEDYDFPSGGIY